MSDLNKARSYYYEFFSYPLIWHETNEAYENFLEQTRFLANAPIIDENKEDFDLILSFSWEDFKEEQNEILFDFSYANVPLTASFYDEGAENGMKKLALKDLLKKTTFRLDKDKFKLGEDHLGFIFGLMATLIQTNEELSNELFENFINEFVDEFIKLMEATKDGKFYKAYINLFKTFIELERNILDIKAPKVINNIAEVAMEKKPFTSKMPTFKSKQMLDEVSLAEDN